MKDQDIPSYICEVCLSLHTDEDLLVLCDHSHLKMATLFVESLGCPLVSIPSLSCNGEEPSSQIASLLEEFDAILALTNLSLGPAHARKIACEKGTRFISLAGITDSSLETIIKTDYALLKERVTVLEPIFESASQIEVKTGKDSLFMSVSGRHPLALTGLVQKKGEFGTLPEGEILISPVESTVHGSFEIDVGMVGLGFFDTPLRFRVQDGVVTDIEGPSRDLETLLNVHEGSRQVAECAIGINPVATCNTIFEAKKMEGTCHISLGDNHTIGGIHRCGIHMDGIISTPTVIIDEVPVVQEGTLVIS
ncbi:MAG: aminopeptidase [Theionarchaea archaeon]|nr:aminopeptidase [Theionarchaea archaeon]